MGLTEAPQAVGEPAVGKTRVLICDDHPVVRDGIRSMLSFAEDMEVVGEARDGLEAVDGAERLKPDVLVIDLEMPRLDGFEAISRVKERRPTTGILVVSGHESAADVSSALRRGASGYIGKDSPPDEFFRAIRAVADGKSALSPDASSVLLAQHQERPEELTGKEVEVLRLVSQGRANKEIAAELGRSIATVGRQLENIFAKLGARDRTHAVAIALSRGIIRFEE